MIRATTLAVGSLIFVGLAFFSGNAAAQQEHAHESPHGGQVLTMGDYHVEFLVVEGKDDKGYIVVYLLDKNLKPVPVDKVKGRVYLTLPDKSKQTLKLAVTKGPAKKDVSHFKAEVNLKGVDSFDSVVSLKMGDKRKNHRFKYVKGK